MRTYKKRVKSTKTKTESQTSMQLEPIDDDDSLPF